MMGVFCDSLITELDDTNYNQFIESNKLTFVKVYVDWCGHCKALIEPFKKLSKKYKQIKFAQMNGDKFPQLKNKLQLQGYPSLLIFVDGIELNRQYFGPVNNIEPIELFLKEILELEMIVFKQEYVQDHKQSNHYFGYGMYCGDNNTEEFTNINKIMRLVNNTKIFYISDKNECENNNLQMNQLIYYKKSGIVSKFKDFSNLKKFQKFLIFARFDSINRFNIDVIGETIGSKLPILVYVNRKTNREQLRILENISSKFNIVIAHNKLKTEFENHYSDMFGVDQNELPSLYIAFIQKELIKFKFESTFQEKQIQQFILDFINNKLDRHFISEKVKDDGKSHLKVVTANSMKNLLLDISRDKVILFYTNACRGCQEAVDILEKVSKELGHAQIYFGKLNTSRNEVMKMDKIPALVFFPKDDTRNMKYFQGGLDIEKIKKFILDNHNRIAGDEL